MHPPLSKRRAFTLIELLVVIAIIAILSVVVILTLNPAELLRQSRDSNRVSDMDTLTHALGIYSTDVTSGSLGSANTIYVSIPDPTATSTAGDQCQGLGLPSLPATYSYHCAASSTNRNVDGTGWIPVNFKNISSGAPIGNLPVDPTNVSSSRLYYAYATNGTTYEVTSPMESIKYKPGGGADVITSDGGSKAFLYEKGTNLALQPLDYGDASLVGYWTMDEGSGSSTYDYSGSNVTGTWNGTAAGTNGYYSAGKVGPWAGAFNGTNDFISMGTSTLYAFTGSFTISAWINTPTTTALETVVDRATNGSAGYHLADYAGFSRFCINTPTEYCSGVGISVASNTWTYIVGVYDGSRLNTYVNGVAGTWGTAPAAPVISANSLLIGKGQQGGWNPFLGIIDDVRIYNRALSAAEIQSLYSGGK